MLMSVQGLHGGAPCAQSHREAIWVPCLPSSSIIPLSSFSRCLKLEISAMAEVSPKESEERGLDLQLFCKVEVGDRERALGTQTVLPMLSPRESRSNPEGMRERACVFLACHQEYRHCPSQKDPREDPGPPGHSYACSCIPWGVENEHITHHQVGSLRQPRPGGSRPLDPHNKSH